MEARCTEMAAVGTRTCLPPPRPDELISNRPAHTSAPRQLPQGLRCRPGTRQALAQDKHGLLLARSGGSCATDTLRACPPPRTEGSWWGLRSGAARPVERPQRAGQHLPGEDTLCAAPGSPRPHSGVPAVAHRPETTMHVARRLEGLTRSLQESKVKGVLVHKAQ